MKIGSFQSWLISLFLAGVIASVTYLLLTVYKVGGDHILLASILPAIASIVAVQVFMRWIEPRI